MNKELELKLVEKYPKILKEYGGDPKQTCMAFGIETSGDGWYNFLHKYPCHKIDKCLFFREIVGMIRILECWFNVNN